MVAIVWISGVMLFACCSHRCGVYFSGERLFSLRVPHFVDLVLLVLVLGVCMRCVFANYVAYCEGEAVVEWYSSSSVVSNFVGSCVFV